MEAGLSSLGVEGALSAKNILTQDASNFGNDESYEFMWAMKTFKYADTHFKLISSFDASKLKLTKFDDQVFRMFKRYFKNFKIDVVETSQLKDEESKARWRPFCELFKGKIEDYNFGTLLRIDSSKGYSEDNTILVTRIQFIAIEVARNRRGLNTIHLGKGQAKESKATGDAVEGTEDTGDSTESEKMDKTEEGSEKNEIPKDDDNAMEGSN